MILWFMMIYDNICMRHTHENIKKYCSIGGLQMIRFDEVDICPGLTWRRGQPCLLLVSMRILIVQHPRWIKAHNITQSTSKYSILYKQKTRTHTHKHQLSPYFKKHICISIVYACIQLLVNLWELKLGHTCQNQLPCSLLLWPQIVHRRFVHVIATLC